MAPVIELIGPFGGPEGNSWRDGDTWNDESGYTGVRSINLTFKGAVGSFSAVYDTNGNPVQGPQHPSGDFSYRPGNAHFNFPVERITQVSGYVGTVPNDHTTTLVVRSITITTNNNIYGPYGVEEGQPFHADIPNNAHISGFVGRSNGYYLNAIGFYQTTP